MTYYSLDVTQMNIIWPAFLQGIGLGLVFVPLSTVAYATLDRHRMAEAAGLFSLVRTVGSAIGISIVTTLLAHQSQILWNELGAYVSQYHERAGRLHAPPASAAHRSAGTCGGARAKSARQAQMGAMLDVFKLITLSYLFMVPLVFLLKKSTTQRAGAAPDAAAAH